MVQPVILEFTHQIHHKAVPVMEEVLTLIHKVVVHIQHIVTVHHKDKQVRQIIQANQVHQVLKRVNQNHNTLMAEAVILTKSIF